MKIKLKHLVLSFLTLALVGCGGSKDSKENDNLVKTVDFDEDNIVFTAPLISDLHIGYSDQNVDNKQRFDYVLKTLKEFYPNGFDAVLSTGDNTQNGTKANVDELLEVYNDNLDLSKTPFFFSHGNHDTCWAGCLTTPDFYDAYGEEIYQYDLDQLSAKLGNRHAKFNGLHFLTVQMMNYGPNNNVISDQTEEWFKSTMDEAILDTPDKPIFVLCHSPAQDTVYGSYVEKFPENDCGVWGASIQLDELLAPYSQAVLFSGHTHYGITDNRTINQTTYTQMNLGSICDLALDSNFEDTKQLIDERQYSFGSVLEVDKFGNSKITRYDFMKKEQIKHPFIINAPKADKSHLLKYNFDHIVENNVDPVFSETGTYLVKNVNNTMVLEFTTPTTNDMIFAYEMRLFLGTPDNIGDFNDYVLSYKMMYDWWNHPTYENNIVITITTKTAYTTNFSVLLMAIDSYGGTASTFLSFN